MRYQSSNKKVIDAHALAAIRVHPAVQSAGAVVNINIVVQVLNTAVKKPSNRRFVVAVGI